MGGGLIYGCEKPDLLLRFWLVLSIVKPYFSPSRMRDNTYYLLPHRKGAKFAKFIPMPFHDRSPGEMRYALHWCEFHRTSDRSGKTARPA